MKSGAAEQISGNPIHLEGELTIYTAAETFTRLQESLGQRPGCELDLSGVTEIDSAGLQLLFWLEQISEARGGGLALIGVSEAVLEVMRLLHLEQRFGIESSGSAGEGAV